jgi:voltage-gated potassium channel
MTDLSIETNVSKNQSQWLHARDVIHGLLHASSIETRGQHWTRVIIASVITLSVLSVILETEPELESNFRAWFYGLEIFTVVIFSIEYLFRVWCIVEDPGYERPILGRLKYIFTPLALVDLVAVLPFFLPALITVDLRFIRILRLIRLVRVMKLGHYSTSLTVISSVIRHKRHEMAAALFIMVILITMASTIMYYVEHDAQPDKFRSIPASMWWSVETLTSVGYGDAFPITTLGKVCCALIAILGIGVVGLPTGIFVAGFVDELQHKRERVLCDECKRVIAEVAAGPGHASAFTSEVLTRR